MIGLGLGVRFKMSDADTLPPPIPSIALQQRRQ